MKDAMNEADPARQVKFDYTNYIGQISVRYVVPIKIEYGSTEWDPEEQWLLTGWDTIKDAERTFAMKDIRNWQPDPE